MNVDFSRPWKEVFALVAEVAAEEKRLKLCDIFDKDRDRQDRDKLRAKEKHEKEKEELERAFEEMLASTERITSVAERAGLTRRRSEPPRLPRTTERRPDRVRTSRSGRWP